MGCNCKKNKKIYVKNQIKKQPKKEIQKSTQTTNSIKKVQNELKDVVPINIYNTDLFN